FPPSWLGVVGDMASPLCQPAVLTQFADPDPVGEGSPGSKTECQRRPATILGVPNSNNPRQVTGHLDTATVLPAVGASAPCRDDSNFNTAAALPTVRTCSPCSTGQVVTFHPVPPSAATSKHQPLREA